MIFGKALRRAALVLLGAAAMGFAARAVAQDIKTETIEYYDDPALWVVGQVKRTTVNGIEASKTDYGWKALPWKTYSFGKLQQQFGYDNTSTVASGQLGTLKQVIDGRANVTTLTLWKRGVPGKVTYPATTDQPTAVSQSAVINDDGTIAQVTDENGFVTKYDYDAMGRLSLVDYPDGDTVPWTSTNRTFSVTGAIYGLPQHWRLWERTGNGYKVTHYDALWRPVVEDTYDYGNVANTRSIVVKRYDAGGRLAFQSYPLASLGNYTDTTLKGTSYTYDSLDRIRTAVQHSELGPLTTTTEYLAGFKTRVTNPRTKQTTTDYYTFDEPSTDWPLHIVHPEGAYTDIGRDIFGKPTWIKRRNADSSLSVTRSYAYHTVGQELCRVVEPETGATLMGYDGAGNLAWSASGLAAGTVCSTTGTETAIVARKAARTYDARNRLKTLSFPDGRGDTTSTWTPDGLLKSIAAENDASNIVTQHYTYNRRRLPESEQMLWGSINWSIGYDYNTNGHLASQTYPGAFTVAYAPDALGRPTQAGTYATGVGYYPNGAIKQFTYGNGIVHTLTQNVRQLPDTSKDAYGATAFLSDAYDYDGNGNVAAITDGATGRNQRGNRTMIYDALDRLTSTASPMFGTATYTYDVLDNLTRTNVTGGNLPRNHYYCYNAARQLAFVRTGAVCTGSTPSPAVTALEYDPQGNLSDKNSQTFAFDYGNRLRSVNSPLTSYVYDGHGRRVRDATGGSRYGFFSQSGQLTYAADVRKGLQFQYIYLGGSLVGIRERDTATGVFTDEYQHTDALGSPVLVTNASRGIVERTEYEPYGRAANRAARDGMGYTGHVEDAATGLVQMQQRYYDPLLGRFLSVDPVTAYSMPGSNFNRYWYANNNPYKFTDPDGRFVLNLIGGGIGTIVGAVGGGVVGYISSGGDAKKTFAGAIGGAVGGAITGATFGAGSKLGVIAAAGVAGGLVGEGTAQTVENAIDHGLDYSSYEYSGGRIVVSGATGALGAMSGGLADEFGPPALNAMQKAALGQSGMIPINTAANLAGNGAEPASLGNVTIGPMEVVEPPPPVEIGPFQQHH